MDVYAPPDDYYLEVKEWFYHKLDLVVVRGPGGDVLVNLGDLNAETGNNMAGLESCLGSHSFVARHVYSQFLLNFTKSKGSWVGFPDSRDQFYAG